MTVHLGPTSRSSSHNDLDDNDVDNHSIYALLAGRSGGQTLFGGTDPGDFWTVQGADDPDLGFIRLKSQVKIDFAQGISTPEDIGGAVVEIDSTFSTSAVDFIGRVILANWNWTVTTNPASYQLFDDAGVIDYDAAAGGFNQFNMAFVHSLARINNAANSLPSIIGLNWSPRAEMTVTGNANVNSTTGLLAGAQLACLNVAGASITAVNGTTGMQFSPTYATFENTTADFGDVVGVEVRGPTQGFFQPAAGTEEMDDYIGLLFKNPLANVVQNGDAIGLKSLLSAAADRWLFRNDGGAKAEFALGSVLYGTLGAPEIDASWDGESPGSLMFSDTVDAPVDGVGVRFNLQSIMFGSQIPDPGTDAAWLQIFPGDDNFRFPPAGANFEMLKIACGRPADQVDLNGASVADFDIIKMEAPDVIGITDLVRASYIRIPDLIFTDAHPAVGATEQLHGIWLGGGNRMRVEGHHNLGSSEPAQITADTNNYSIPTFAAARTIMRLTTDATRHLTGMKVNQEEDLFYVWNGGSFDLVLDHENVSSTSSFRFTSPTGADYVLAPNEGCWVWHENSLTGSDRWVILDHAPRDAELEDVGAWTVMLRNAGTTGKRADVKITGLAEEFAPASGDFLMLELAGGELRKTNIGSLPGGGGTTVATDTIWTTKGDMVAATGASAAVAFGVGADGTVLVADSGPAHGVSWAKVTHARSQDIGAYTIQMRNAGTSGVRADTKISALTAAVPVSGDFFLGELSTGELRKYDVGNSYREVDDDLIWDALGDLVVGSGADAAARLAIGAADTVLVRTAGATAGWEKITHARSQDIGAWTLQMRNAGTSGVRSDTKISALTTEATPASGDFMIVELATGELRRADIGTLPSGGGGNVASDTIWDAKGDIAAATAADTAVALTVGANNTVLVADSVQTEGLKWDTLGFNSLDDVAEFRMVGRNVAGVGPLSSLSVTSVIELLNLEIGVDFEKALTHDRGWPLPADGDVRDWFYTNIAITVTECRVVLPDGTASPSVDINVMHSTGARAASPNKISGDTPDPTVTNTTTGTAIVLNNDPTIPAASYVWIELSDKSGTVPWIHVHLRYTED